jgi:DNA-binding transcriptional ArsR family regulator
VTSPLTAIRSPATPTDLARALDVTPSAIPQHLRVLRDSGLISRRRAGRTVLYTTTALGIALTTRP